MTKTYPVGCERKSGEKLLWTTFWLLKSIHMDDNHSSHSTSVFLVWHLELMQSLWHHDMAQKREKKKKSEYVMALLSHWSTSLDQTIFWLQLVWVNQFHHWIGQFELGSPVTVSRRHANWCTLCWTTLCSPSYSWRNWAPEGRIRFHVSQASKTHSTDMSWAVKLPNSCSNHHHAVL